MMERARHSLNVIPAEAGTHVTLPRGCAVGIVERGEACVDGRLRGHDGSRSG